jgi:hypothetical protein
VPSNADSLYGLAAELLAKSAAILAASVNGAPTNQYVAHGPPAYDCPDSLIVNTGAVAYGPFARGPSQGTAVLDPKSHVVPLVPLTVTVLRCVNQQAMPSGGVAIQPAKLAAVQADAQKVYRDGWSLFCGLRKMNRDGTLFAGFPCRFYDMTGALPVSPEGGALGWTLDVIVQLDGFDPAGA